MIAVLSDTHGRRDARLTGAAAAAVHDADLVIHAGDFTALSVLEAFEVASHRLHAVYGNVDDGAVRNRLSASETVDVEGVRIVVVHGHEHSETGLAMLGRQEDADLVISGHTHRSRVADAGDVTLLNPGSHADPRGGIATHAVLEVAGGGIDGRILDADGTGIERFQR